MPTKFIRKRNRLPFKEIYQGGHWYFVTICTQDKKCIFEMCLNGKLMFFNDDVAILENGDTVVLEGGDTVVASTANIRQISEVASTEITKLCEKSLLNLCQIYDNVSLGEWVVMPNHIHFILGFPDTPVSKDTKKETDLGGVIKSFKLHFQKSIVEATTVSPFSNIALSPLLQKHFQKHSFNYHKFWQKSFYDHVIRDERDLQRVREYICNNPLQWRLDILNPKNDEQYQLWINKQNQKLKLD